MEFVTVRHPDIEGTGEVSRAAYDATYAEKGWVVVDEQAPPAPTEPAPSETPIADGLTAETPNPIQPEV